MEDPDTVDPLSTSQSQVEVEANDLEQTYETVIVEVEMVPVPELNEAVQLKYFELQQQQQQQQHQPLMQDEQGQLSYGSIYRDQDNIRSIQEEHSIPTQVQDPTSVPNADSVSFLMSMNQCPEPIPTCSSSSRPVPENVPVTESICLICANLVDFDSVPMQKNSVSTSYPPSDSVLSTSEQLLHLLLYAFSISPSIYQGQGLDINSLPVNLYCSFCKMKLFEAIQIMDEMQSLESKLKRIRSEIKLTLRNSHYQSQNINVPSFASHNSYSDPHYAIKLLRKTFAQCWSKCDVCCPVLGPKSRMKLKSRTASKSKRKNPTTPVPPTTTVEVQRTDQISCLLPTNSETTVDQHNKRVRPQRHLRKPSRYTESETVESKSIHSVLKVELVEPGLNSDQVLSPEPELNLRILKQDIQATIEPEHLFSSPVSPSTESERNVDFEVSTDINEKVLEESQGQVKYPNSISFSPKSQCRSKGKGNGQSKRKKRPYCSILKIRKAHRAPDLPFKCGICSKGYRSEKHLKLHENFHKGLLDFPCTQCTRKFASSFSLQLHNIYFHNHPTKKSDPNYKRPSSRIPKKNATTNENAHLECDQNQIINIVKTRVRPKSTTTSVNRRTKLYCQRFLSEHHFTCKYCTKDFFKKDYLQPNGMFLFSCDIFGCDRKFSNFLIFGKHHERTCLARVCPEKFTCEFCGKDCSSSQTLEAHKISFHTKNYEFCCEVCGMGLVSKGSYKRHMQQHSEEKKFKCTFCPTAYKRKDYLVTHLKRHTNADDLPYTCDKCGKGFTDSVRLNRHKTIHNEVNMFPCPICSKLFKSKNYVNSHVWSMHKMGSRRKNRGVGKNRVKVEVEVDAPNDENGQKQVHLESQGEGRSNYPQYNMVLDENDPNVEIERQVEIIQAEGTVMEFQYK